MNIRQPLKQHASFLKLAGAILALFSLAACLTPAVLLHALQTAAAEGKQIASTQLPAIQQTAELSVTEIGPPPQLPEFSLATLMAEAASDHPNVEVQVARDRLKKVEAMQSPWNQVDAPIKSAPGQRSASSYANVIDQFDVKAAAFAGRYVAGGADSSDSAMASLPDDDARHGRTPTHQGQPGQRENRRHLYRSGDCTGVAAERLPHQKHPLGDLRHRSRC
jgi:hypothetical protein